MLRHCQHRLAFTKTVWYAHALEAILPHNKKLPFKPWYRSTNTLATALKENNMRTTTFVTPSPLPIIEPLQSIKNSLPESNSTLQTYQRCTGFRRYDGQRCQRLVKVDPSIPVAEHVVCYNHRLNKPPIEKKKKNSNHNNINNNKKKTKKQTSQYHGLNNASEEEINHHIQSYMSPAIEKSMFKAPNKVYDCWDLWIGKHIKKTKSTIIRREMKKPVSKLDKDGFIYAYSIPNGPRASQNTHAYFKIGRTNNPHRRMYQVSNVCKLDPKIIETFPSFPIDENQKTLSTNLATLKNTLAEIPMCPLSHRVEKLIHLELSSLYKRAGFKCPHCGKTHREWIRINRRKGPDGEPMTDRELWISCIRPVILKWIKYGVLASVVNRQE